SSAISKSFFGEIEKSQIGIAKEAKRVVESRVGSYSEFKKYLQDPNGAPDSKTLLRARNMAAVSFTIQDVRGDVTNAERSFLKINQSATPIHPTELTMIQARKKPNALAARALLRAGSGHEYWWEFDDNTKKNIVSLARDIYENLFKPLLESPIRTLELPAAGQALTPDSLDLVFTLVNHINGAVDTSTKKKPGNWKHKTKSGTEEPLEDDKDGSMTLQFLQSVKDATRRVFGSDSGSLALHTSVYCYGATGRFQPTAFFAAIDFVDHLETHRAFDKFTAIRANFENFLIEYRHFINQIVGSYGSQLKGLPALTKMYKIIYNNIGTAPNSTLVNIIKSDPELSFITEISEDDRKYGRNFSRETSNAIFLKQAIQKALTCGICGARIHTGTITLDHKDRKEDGGLGSLKNGQIAHPYCNHGYKEKMTHAAKSNS
ncbi:HNH endonuclease signature motif containing protein, partial [Azospirillum sp. B4]|uniref:HNH endonuclease signature motif containing protein n=1 Tax=Azospirillum sp. B4 TaxID=95605 RepID=UPI00131EECC4